MCLQWMDEEIQAMSARFREALVDRMEIMQGRIDKAVRRAR